MDSVLLFSWPLCILFLPLQSSLTPQRRLGRKGLISFLVLFLTDGRFFQLLSHTSRVQSQSKLDFSLWPTQFCFLEVFFLKEILFMHLNVFLLGTGKKRATRWILIANLLFLVPSFGISIHFDASVFHKRSQVLLFSE